MGWGATALLSKGQARVEESISTTWHSWCSCSTLKLGAFKAWQSCQHRWRQSPLQQEPSREKRSMFCMNHWWTHTLVSPTCREGVELYHNLGGKAKSFLQCPEVHNNKPDKPSKIPPLVARRSCKHRGVIGKKQHTFIILTLKSCFLDGLKCKLQSFETDFVPRKENVSKRD